MQTIMTNVAAVTIRATNASLPGYGLSSSLSHSNTHPSGRLEAGGDCAMDAISASANHHDGRFAHPEQIRRRILDSHPNRIAGSQVHPVQRSLHIRQAFPETANDVCVWSHTKSDAVHDAGKALVRFRQDINVGSHPGRDVL